MIRRHPRMTALVALSIAASTGVLAAVVSQVDQPYPGFFFSADYRVFPVSPESRAAGLAHGDRIVTVGGHSPLSLMARVESSSGPLRYEVERDGRRFTVDLAPRAFTWSDLISDFAGYFAVSAVMLAVGLLVFAQNPAAIPNRNFLIYMCLWAVSNVAVPEAVLGTRKHAAILLSFVPPLLCVHGWIFFLTYPVNPARQAWLERHRVGPRLYWAALAAGVLMSLVFVVVYLAAPGLLAHVHAGPADPLLPAAGGSSGRLGAGLALPAGHRLRHGPLPALRRHRGDPPLAGLHHAGRPHHRRLRPPAGRGQRAPGAGGPHALPLVLGRLHVRGGGGLQPAAGVGEARGGPDLLPGAVRLRADDSSVGALHEKPARPRRDRAPAGYHDPVGHARERGEALDRIAGARHPDGAGYRPRGALALPGGGRPALRAGQHGSPRSLRVARCRGDRPAPIPSGASGAPAPRAQALRGGLYRRGPGIAGDAGRPGGRGRGQCRGAPPGARLRPGARAEPPDPHQPRQVRAPAGAPAHRGVARGAVARETRDRGDRALRGHQRLHAAHRAAVARRFGRARGALLRRLLRRDRQARRRRERDGGGRPHGDLPRG